MFCNKCGEKNVKNALFCKYCGAPIKGSDIASKITTISQPAVNKSEDIWVKVLGWGATFIGMAAGKFLGLAIFVLIIPAWLGYYLINWYMKRDNQSSWILNLLVWSNLLTWIFPVAGYFTAVASITLSSRIESNLKQKAKILGWICLIFSLINSISGIIINSQH